MTSALKHDVFQALADPTRRKILQLLSREEMAVGKISEPFPISRTAVTKHLSVLSDAGLVRERKTGRERRYRLQPEPLLEVKQWLAYYERFWDKKLAALKDHVDTG